MFRIRDLFTLSAPLMMPLFLQAVFLGGCTDKKDGPSNPKAVTNRPTNINHFTATIKLKHPPLFSQMVQGEDGKMTVDSELKEAILAEQVKFEERLASISDEIKVIYKYRFVLNGMAVVAPNRYKDMFENMVGTSSIAMEFNQKFDRMSPVETAVPFASGEGFGANTPVGLMGAYKVHEELGITGKGIRVGVIDTGIDYTHLMFGGEGTVEAYKANDPKTVEEGSFPTAKVVGGYDFVGEEYNAASPVFANQIPTPDNDPLDIGGHGSHVAGTIAGIGDGVNSFSGVAPNAELYALKVFGPGSTSDSVVIAALEYAADPDGDLDPSDKLDIVNLSLGSGFGTPHELYGDAVANLTKGGIVSVISAGNSGDVPYIVGSPGISTEAISVAATVDAMEHNTSYPAIVFEGSDGEAIKAKYVEAGISIPIKASGVSSGKLVYIGLADQPLSADKASALSGNIALIDRGAVSFCKKAKTALDGGAIAFIVANNKADAPFAMGGECQFRIPGLMISKAIGDQMKLSMESSDIVVQLTGKIIAEELIDTITDFSSRGPRSTDGLIKPEVGAPGKQILSAKVGGGAEGVKYSGTSMAAPNLAGVAALLKQHRKGLTPAQYKSLLVNYAKIQKDEKGKRYPVARQGAGRVKAFETLTGDVVFNPPTLSFGEVGIESGKAMTRYVKISNLSNERVVLNLESSLSDGITLQIPSTVALDPKEEKRVRIVGIFKPQFNKQASKELDGFLFFKQSDKKMAHMPVLAVANKASRIEVESLKVFSSSANDSEGAAVEMTIANKGKTIGEAMAFNLIGEDKRKDYVRANRSRGGYCDLQSAGYRVVKEEIQGKSVDVLEIAAKLYNPVTTYDICEISIQIDQNGDGVADQELLGTPADSLTNTLPPSMRYASLLTDANAMRNIRIAYELAGPDADDPDYTNAIVSAMTADMYEHSTLSVVRVELDKVKKTLEGDIRIKVGALAHGSVPGADDFLSDLSEWKVLGLESIEMGYVDLPKTISLDVSEKRTVHFTKGGGDHELVIYFPYNGVTFSNTKEDHQSAKPELEYLF